MSAFKFPSDNSRAVVTMKWKINVVHEQIKKKILFLNLFDKLPTANNFLWLQKVNLLGP